MVLAHLNVGTDDIKGMIFEIINTTHWDNFPLVKLP